ncbi:MAG: ABC transporter ATP-binding protein [Candidatus Bathyarchaeia archaeon]|nr:ABC transporter ATP-binding protein [Candidatus Bathyarchaeia archaeon]
MEKLLSVENLKIYYWTLRGYVHAVENINFSLNKGDTLGLAGESGCGKTTAMMGILRLLPSNAIVEGKIFFEGQNLLEMSPDKFRKEIRWKKIATVFQGAMSSLHPILTIGDQIAEAILLHENIGKEEALKRAGSLLDLVGVKAERLNRYPHELSGGLKQRAMIAMSLACNPTLVIADEPTTALDVIVEAQVLKVMKEIQQKLGLTMIFVTHDLSLIAETCNKVAIMYAGKIVEMGDVVEVYKEPFHLYTQKLLSAFPSILGRKTELTAIPGFPPDLLSPPPGCKFHPRCDYAMEICRKEEPPEIYNAKRLIACHLYPKGGK